MRYFLSAIIILFTFSATKAQWEEVDPWFASVDGAFSFVIDGKAYVGGGVGAGVRDDFGVFDPDTESWTNLGKLPFGPRGWAFAFAVNGKGYVGGGDSKGNLTGVQKDFWEYDPSTDTWTRKSDYPGGKRDGCFSFSINGKGYVGAGFDGQYVVSDAYEYNPVSDNWTQISDVPEVMIFPAHFVIDGKGYVGIPGKGFDNQGTTLYELDPNTKEWTQKSNFPDEARQATAAFVYNGKAYIGGGQSNYNKNYQDVYSYDPKSDKWNEEKEMSLPYNNTGWPIAFNLGDTGYFGLGVVIADFNFTNKMYKWDFVKKPKISVSQSQIDFGEVKVGESSNQNITITNTGAAILNINKMNIDNNEVFSISVDTPFEIQPGELMNFTIDFTPPEENTFTGKLSIESNAESVETEIPLQGIGYQANPNITLSEETIDMGKTDLNNNLTHTLIITNTGSGELKISEAHIKDIDKGFSIPDMNYPLMIKASESLNIDISFEQNDPGYYETELIIGTNVEGKETLSIPLTAVVENNISGIELQDKLGFKFNLTQEYNSITINVEFIKPNKNNTNLFIYDLNGNLIEEYYFTNNNSITKSIDLNEYSSGTYIVTLFVDGKALIKKFSIVK